MPKGVEKELFCHQKKNKFKHFIEIKCLGSEILLLLNDYNEKVKLNWGNSHIEELEQSPEKEKEKKILKKRDPRNKLHHFP